MPMRRVAVAVLGLVLAGGTAEARTLDQVPPYLKNEGPFVALPAIGGAALGMGIGALIGLPASVVAAPVGWASGDPLGYALFPVSVLGAGGAEIGYHLFGAIPYGLKNAFYDAPMYAVHRIKGDPQSGLVAQVEPPAPEEVNPQYLDSTPPDARVPVEITQRYSSALPAPKEPTSLMLKRQMSPFKPPPMPTARAPAAAPRNLPSGTVPASAAIPPVAQSAPLAPASRPAVAIQPPAPLAAPPPMVEVPRPAVELPVLRAPVAPAGVEQNATASAAVVREPVLEPPPSVVPPEPVAARPVPGPDVSVPPEPTMRGRIDGTRTDALPPASDQQDEEGAEAERPQIKKKKRKFSERFHF